MPGPERLRTAKDGAPITEDLADELARSSWRSNASVNAAVSS
jgi:hypothetical protein